jgi:hypothetical protein
MTHPTLVENRAITPSFNMPSFNMPTCYRFKVQLSAFTLMFDVTALSGTAVGKRVIAEKVMTFGRS